MVTCSNSVDIELFLKCKHTPKGKMTKIHPFSVFSWFGYCKNNFTVVNILA